MIKTLYIVASVVTAFVVTLFFMPDQNVTVTQKAPAQILPGHDFILELTINKGSVDGFARLQQNLPAGFKAEPVEIGKAKFIFEDQFVKLIWFALPDDPSFTISYKITVDSTVKGNQTLSGIFSYIEKDKTLTIDINPITIKVSNGDEASSPTADASKQEDKVNDVSDSAGAVEISRNMPDKISLDKDFLVELTVKNKSIHGSAKIVEHIPKGWLVQKGQTSGALFKTQDSLVKFIWLNLPKDSVFKVSYHLKPGKNIKASQSIYGTFAFDDNGTPRSFDYFPAEITSNTADANTQAQQKNPDPVSAAIKESLKQSHQPKDMLLAQASSTPSPETGIIYKVQIAACRKDVKDVTYFNQHYHLEGNVSAEMNEGWHKYVIGSFNQYHAARDMRVNTHEKVAGAFVVAYNNGQRITVREALTATGQKWFQ